MESSSCSSRIFQCHGSFWGWNSSKRLARVRPQAPRVLLPILVSSSLRGDGESFPNGHVKTEGNGMEALQAPVLSEEKGSVVGTSDMMKLFNDTQQNMLHLNKQRLIAVEKLKKSKMDNELLLARIGQLEAEMQASAAHCDVLQRQMQTLESKLNEGSWWLEKHERKGSTKKVDPPSIFSKLMLRIDSMVLIGALSTSQAGALRSLVLMRDTQAGEIFHRHEDKDDKELAQDLLSLLDPNRRHGLHIVHICTELAPVAVSGVLGAYVTGLSRALRRKGNFVEVILPKFVSADLKHVKNLREMPAELYSFFGGHWNKNKLWTGVVHGIPVTFIEPFHPGGFFSREHFYNYSDDFERFTYFCRASLELLVRSGKQPDILHLHNWQTAAAAPLFWDIFVNQGLGGTRIMFTCHDFKYQCVQEPHKLALCGLDPQQLHRPDRLQDNLNHRLVNLLKGGIVYSNKVTTPSPQYAKDLIIREHGLKATLITHKNKFEGIYNGLDESIWNPRHDPLLPSNYSLEDLSGKAHCKEVLREKLGLTTSSCSTPLVGCIAPQVSDLELELMKSALNCTLMKRAEFVFMGSSKVPHIQKILDSLQQVSEKKDGCVLVKYDESVAHAIVAASDILVCASINEPASQMQLIAMQYGAVPVSKQESCVHRSVIDADDVAQSEATGFTFQSAKGADLMVALSRAIDLMNSDTERWKGLIRNGMSKDFSWDAICVDAYMDSYQSIL